MKPRRASAVRCHPLTALRRRARQPCVALSLLFALAVSTPALGEPPTGGVAPSLDRDVYVSNPIEATRAVWAAMDRAQVGPLGTAYANVTLDDAGYATVGAVFGTLYRNEKALGIVREATPKFRFAVPTGRMPAGERQWVAFWIFQTHGCRDRLFDAPPDVTVVRVCLDLDDAGHLKEAPFVRFEPSRPFPGARIRPNPAIRCDYPPDSRRANEQGTVSVVVRVDANGVAHDPRVVESSLSESLDHAAAACVAAIRYQPWGGTAPGDGLVVMRWTWKLDD